VHLVEWEVSVCAVQVVIGLVLTIIWFSMKIWGYMNEEVSHAYN